MLRSEYCLAAYQILSKSTRSLGCKEFHRYLTPPPWRHSRWCRDKKRELHSRVRDEAAAAHSSSTAAASPRAEDRGPALLLQGRLLSGPRVGRGITSLDLSVSVTTCHWWWWGPGGGPLVTRQSLVPSSMNISP